MVIGQVLSFETLHEMVGDPEEKDQYLMRLYGLTPRDLDYVRNPEKLFDKIYRAVEILYERTNNPVHLTGLTISALVYDYWDNPNTNYRNVYNAIRDFYIDEVTRITSKYRLKPPPIELLRHDVMGTNLPFLKERKVWKKFQPSSDDWLRDVKLPLNISEEVAELLGIYLAEGNIGNRGLYLSGLSKDFMFYNDVIVPRIRTVHNLPVKVSTISHNQQEFQGRRYSFNRPRINVQSKAICTWLIYDLGFPETKVDVPLPKLHGDRQEKGFFTGIISGLGSVGFSGECSLTEQDFTFAMNIAKISRKLGFTPNLIRVDREIEGKPYTEYYIRFSRNEVAKMKLINPRHRLNKLYSQISN